MVTPQPNPPQKFSNSQSFSNSTGATILHKGGIPGGPELNPAFPKSSDWSSRLPWGSARLKEESVESKQTEGKVEGYKKFLGSSHTQLEFKGLEIPCLTEEHFSGDEGLANPNSGGVDNLKSKCVKSKHFSIPVSPYNGKPYIKPNRSNFSLEDFYFNSSYFAQAKLKNVKSLPKSINFRGRRKLRKMILIASLKQDELILHESFFGNISENQDRSIIIDSGTTLHIGRDRIDFKSVSAETVRIRGATGTSCGYKGILAESPLGYDVPAIWYPQLPVRMLLSVQGLNRDGWSSIFNEEIGNHCQNRRTGKIINMHNSKGLPCLNISFREKYTETGYSAQIVENPDELEECHYCDDQELPRHIAKGCVETKTRKRGRPWGPKEVKPPPKSRVSKLLDHQRNCHFSEPTARCRCFDCLEMKGRKMSHGKTRSQQHEIDSPFILFSCDFFGKIIPKSFRGHQWVLVFCCDSCGYSKAVPIPTKDAAPEVLVDFVREVRAKCGIKHGEMRTTKNKLVFAGIHSDNEAVLRGESWRLAVRNTGLQELHSVPYCPQQNGTCERLVGTIKSALRTTMHNVDPRVWDYCTEHIIKVWNIRNSTKATKYSKDGKPKCPEDIMEQISDNPLYRSGILKRKHLKRFGCLTFFKRDVSPESVDMLKNGPLLPRRVKGIYLGFSEANSAWLVGTINSEGRFQVYETVDAVFLESVLVRDIVQTCKLHNLDPLVDTSVTDLSAQSLLDRTRPTAGDSKSVGGSEEVSLQGLEEALARQGSEKPYDPDVLKGILGGEEEESLGDMIIEEDPKQSSAVLDFTTRVQNTQLQASLSNILAPKTVATDGQSNGSRLVEDYPIEEVKPKVSKPKGNATNNELSDGVTLGPPSVKRKRGRPAGAKDKSKRSRRTKTEVRDARLAYNCSSFWLEEVPETDLNREEYAHLAYAEDDIEESTEFEIFLVRDDQRESKPGDSVRPAWAFSDVNPERPKWIEAKNLEQTRLVAYDTWRKLTESEEEEWRRGRLKAVPCALLLNRKRCGRYKARLVVLGNRWEPGQNNNVYASVVSQVGNRAVVTHCAREGFSIVPFDISNAFVRAEMGDVKVIVRLPESFRNEGENEDGKRMLKKALYGLPISPRLWAKTLNRDLIALGYEECKSEPGVYRKVVNGKTIAYITVYVDDCIVGAQTKEEVELEVQAIHAKHPLSRIETKIDKEGTQHFDMCGADIAYNSFNRTLKISMSNYIDKIMKKYDMVGCKPRSTPSFPERNLYNKDAKPSDFKYKAAIGALQWLATTARPDIAHSVNMLARAGANPVNNSMQKCTKLIFRYLAGTRDIGITYSPEQEKQFNLIYSAIGRHEFNKEMKADDVEKAVHLFTDASFGVEYKTLRSITGIVVYLHGTPIAWRTKVQTIHTSSTTESEWVALADGIEWSQSCYGLQLFLTGRKETDKCEGPIWCDNRPAVINARKGPDATEEIPKRTRHIALRYARVLDHSKRVWFVPTDLELADGLTKSNNREALLQIFERNPEYYEVDPEEDANEDLDFSDTFLLKMGPSYKLGARRDLTSFLAILE